MNKNVFAIVIFSPIYKEDKFNLQYPTYAWMDKEKKKYSYFIIDVLCERS